MYEVLHGHIGEGSAKQSATLIMIGSGEESCY